MKIEREKVPVIVYMKDFKIEGILHIPPGGRLTDFMNAGNKVFIPLTDTTVYKTDTGEKLYEVGLMQINKNFVQLIFPKQEIKNR